MNILLLGEKSSLLNNVLQDLGHSFNTVCDKITKDIVMGYDFIISFGYRYIIKDDIITLFPNKIINLHISYLPYNKGADPNIWSYLEDTIKGVTIHYIKKELDTGDIIAQQQVQDMENDTLKTSYDRLIENIVLLFSNNAENILNGSIKGKKQQGAGSFHYLIDKEKYMYLLKEKGYDTLVKDIKGKALINENS